MSLTSFEKYFDFEPGSRIGTAKMNITVPRPSKYGGFYSITVKKGECIEVFTDGFDDSSVNFRILSKATICMDIETRGSMFDEQCLPRIEGRAKVRTIGGDKSDAQSAREQAWFELVRRYLPEPSVLVDKPEKETDSGRNEGFDPATGVQRKYL